MKFFQKTTHWHITKYIKKKKKIKVKSKILVDKYVGIYCMSEGFVPSGGSDGRQLRNK